MRHNLELLFQHAATCRHFSPTRVPLGRRTLCAPLTVCAPRSTGLHWAPLGSIGLHWAPLGTIGASSQLGGPQSTLGPFGWRRVGERGEWRKFMRFHLIACLMDSLLLVQQHWPARTLGARAEGRPVGAKVKYLPLLQTISSLMGTPTLRFIQRPSLGRPLAQRSSLFWPPSS